jgi:hypothetical protein
MMCHVNNPGNSAGEGEQRLYQLDAWEESPYYSDRERAALAWPKAFREKELADLTLVIVAINAGTD